MMTDEEREIHRFTGSLIPVSDNAAFGQILDHPGVINALSGLGFEKDSTKWMSGFVISKPGCSPSLAWHQVLIMYPHSAFVA
jgi:hypothetical protein